MAQQRQQSFRGVLTQTKDLLQASEKLIPGIVVVSMVLAAGLIAVCLLSVYLMVGAVVVLVLLGSLLVFGSTQNYGQAALALVAGLLTAYTVEWTVGRFITFMAVWVAFSLFAIIISSVRLAANVEHIYVQAAGFLVDESAESTAQLAKRLQAIGSQSTPFHQMLPAQRAEAIRLFVYRKIPIDGLSAALASTELVAVVAGVDVLTAARFIADLSRVVAEEPQGRQHTTVAQVLDAMRESAVPPADFISGFESSRSLLLSGRLRLDMYFDSLQRVLEAGVSPKEAREAMSVGLRRFHSGSSD